MAFRKNVRGRSIGFNEGNVFISRDGLGTGGNREYSEIIAPGSIKYTAYYEDFHGDVVPDECNVVEADTGGGSSSAVVAGANGIFRLFSTAATAILTTAEGQEINGGLLSWNVAQGAGQPKGDLRFATRIRLASVSRTANRVHVFAGFTDNASFEIPVYDTGGGIQATATDAVGFFFSAGGDTGWNAVGVDGGTAQEGNLDTGVAANEWHDLQVCIKRSVGDTGGTATFFVDGVEKGTISDPLGVNVPLTWAVTAWHQDTGTGAAVDVDYIAVSNFRDTGD